MQPQSVKFPIHLDSCEYCPVPHNGNFLSVGGYELDPTTNTRKGEIYIYSLKDNTVKASVSVPGVLDMKWIPMNTGTDKASLGLAAADGSIRILAVTELGDGCIKPLMSWKGHDLEAWCVAFDNWKEGVLYSGADDSKLKGWDSRVGEDAVMWCNSKEHKAGVCCIAPNPFKEHVVVSGSYDEFARFWDVRNLSAPTMRAKIPCGGGVWRLKYHPVDPNTLAAACMQNGSAVLTEGNEDPVEAMCREGNLVYGIDWALDNEGSRIIATCSFYDNLLTFWAPNAILKM